MPRIAYVNGRYVAHADAAVHIEDRGYQFADGVYEVCEVARGYIVDMTRHLDRLDRSLRRTAHRLADAPQRARDRHARGHPPQPRRATASSTCRSRAASRAATSCFPADAAAVAGRDRQEGRPGASRPRAPRPASRSITVPENRWDRVDIKSVGLLPNVLAKEQRQGGRRAGGLVRRRRRQRQGRRLVQCLDRHQGRRAGHPPGRARHPARHHAHDAVRRRRQARA